VHGLGSRRVAKVNSGLGELPRYLDWIDPTGRSPVELVMAATDSTRWL